MKKLHLVIALLSAAVISFAAPAQAQSVVGSDHDLSAGNGGVGTQVCVYCHTPHNGSNTGAPLWNRTNNPGTTYTMYTSTTLAATPSGAPTGVSLACLSCHDGLTAFDSLIRPPVDVPPLSNPAVIADVNKRVGFGGDLTNDHPISITLSVNSELQTAANVTAAGLTLYGGGDQVECGSCHNPHDQATNGKFLRMSNTASALCTTCHVK